MHQQRLAPSNPAPDHRREEFLRRSIARHAATLAGLLSGSVVEGRQIRRIILEQAHRAHVGHIGSALSIADIVAVLYGHALKVSSPTDPERDRVVLSKGHAALALYAALYLRGWITPESLSTYCGNASALGVHPEREVAGVDFSTGSLGQGLSVAAGAALAARMQGASRRIFAIMSDAECNEGAVWEAAMFAAQRELANLVVIIDLNGQQALGQTSEILNLTSMARRWEAFGWDTHEVDGHSPTQLASLIGSLSAYSGPPHVVVAHTTFGKGVSFMERQLKWHYWPMSDAEYLQALGEVDAEPCAVDSFGG